VLGDERHEADSNGNGYDDSEKTSYQARDSMPSIVGLTLGRARHADSAEDGRNDAERDCQRGKDNENRED